MIKVIIAICQGGVVSKSPDHHDGNFMIIDINTLIIMKYVGCVCCAKVAPFQ